MDRRLSALARVLVALLLASAPAVADPSDGDPVVLTGQVVDQDGAAVAGVTVLLEAAERRFSLRHFEQRTGEALQLPAVTDEDGRFRFDWRWDRHYNRFELAVGLEVTRGGNPGFEILERRDVTAEMSSGSPPALRFELVNAGWLRWLEAFMAGDAGEAEKKLYRELGRPQKLTLEDGARAWWYFELGKVYRFEGDELDQVIHFDPVTQP